MGGGCKGESEAHPLAASKLRLLLTRDRLDQPKPSSILMRCAGRARSLHAVSCACRSPTTAAEVLRHMKRRPHRSQLVDQVVGVISLEAALRRLVEFHLSKPEWSLRNLAENKIKLPAARLQIVVVKDGSSFSGAIERLQNAVEIRKGAATAIKDVRHGKTAPSPLLHSIAAVFTTPHSHSIAKCHHNTLIFKNMSLTSPTRNPHKNSRLVALLIAKENLHS